MDYLLKKNKWKYILRNINTKMAAIFLKEFTYFLRFFDIFIGKLKFLQKINPLICKKIKFLFFKIFFIIYRSQAIYIGKNIFVEKSRF